VEFEVRPSDLEDDGTVVVYDPAALAVHVGPQHEEWVAVVLHRSDGTVLHVAVNQRCVRVFGSDAAGEPEASDLIELDLERRTLCADSFVLTDRESRTKQ
jgi:hypothetical protein